MKIIGWDIGGAHIKAVKIDFKKKKTKTLHTYSPVWKNIKNLKNSINSIKKSLGKADYNAITMTAELTDIFSNRAAGVKKIVTVSSKLLGEKKTFFYNKKNFIKKNLALKKFDKLGSMNWHSTAKLVSNSFSDCILVDIGSTTTDITPIKKNKILSTGKNDKERLKTKELLCLGVLRTPIHAIEKKKNIMYENFSDLGDVYRVLNKIPNKFDNSPTLDKKSKSKHASARRLARIFGKDYKKNNFVKLKKIAKKIADKQKKIVKKEIYKVRKKNFSKSVPIVGAGVGCFLLKSIFKKKYISFYNKLTLIRKKNSVNCEAAIATAINLNRFLKRKRSKFRYYSV